uniref:protein SMG7-like n=1 Tax=Erigeron canadensis TaxID=72917 RepID=UPI001CB97AB6|nr:protein SMG7-like [Erigeron canadensis]
MTVPMNNTLGNSSRERAQHHYTKIPELDSKCRKAAQAKIPSDSNAWQQMRDNYESFLLDDHELSEQHEIECALWNLHYKRIEEFRGHYNTAQASAKGPLRSGPNGITKIRSQFNTFLSDATRFYHDLMVKIRGKYGLSLDYMLDDSQNNIDGNKSIDVKKGLMSCHQCFIYLGDLARYKGLYGEGDSKSREFAAASNYYKQAATLWPSSGNPHNQLAILASYSGDELLSIYHYFRSLAVDAPFITARENLIIAFEKNRQIYCQLLGDLKPTSTKKAPSRMNGKGRNRGDMRVSLKDRKKEPTSVEDKELNGILKTFCTQFVRLNGILFTRTSLETFEEVFSFARRKFLQLLCSGCDDEVLCFGSDFNECKLFITRFTSLMIFTVYNANKDTENQSYTEILQRSVVLQNALSVMFDFMALIVDRCVQLNDPFGSFLLPGIMIFVEWLACCQDVVVTNELEEKQAAARSLFWNHFVSFLNKIVSSGSENEDKTCFYNLIKYDEVETNSLALPEDFELRGFLPLVRAHLILDFSRKNYFGGDETNEKIARVQRILAAGKALATNLQIGQQGIYFDVKSKKFFFGVKPPNANEVSVINGESEEEDEVIVFKPAVSENHYDGFSSKLTSSRGIIGDGTDSLMSHGSFPSEPPASSVDGNMQYLQFVQPNTSKWMGGEDLIENGVSNLNLFGNGHHTKPERQVSLGYLKSRGFGSSPRHSFQDPETEIPSKFDSVMTSAHGFDIIPSNTKFHKSPVSRPVRHFGPPPGFNTPAPKSTNEPLPNVNLKGNQNLSPALDDYSWLDGYQLPYSACSEGFGNSFNCLPQPNKLLNTHKTSLGMESFPFPGKQVSSMPDGIGNGMQNGWLEYRIPEHPSFHQESAKKGNEQYIAVPQQYQGQSLWEGQFFV